jgi:hypothetical protein
MPRFARYLLLSALMLAGTAIAYYLDLDRLALPAFLAVVAKVLVVVSVFGWLPMLMAAILVLRRQSPPGLPKQCP